MSVPLAKPGWQIGAGLGGAIGLAVGFFSGLVGAGHRGLVAGLLLGALIGNGIELVLRDPRQQATDRSPVAWHGDRRALPYLVFIFEGNASGGLFLRSLPAKLRDHDSRN